MKGVPWYPVDDRSTRSFVNYFCFPCVINPDRQLVHGGWKSGMSPSSERESKLSVLSGVIITSKPEQIFRWLKGAWFSFPAADLLINHFNDDWSQAACGGLLNFFFFIQERGAKIAVSHSGYLLVKYFQQVGKRKADTGSTARILWFFLFFFSYHFIKTVTLKRTPPRAKCIKSGCRCFFFFRQTKELKRVPTKRHFRRVESCVSKSIKWST